MPSKLYNPVNWGTQNVSQRPWTPTKRRGPIGAEFRSPGPAIVLLPSTFGPDSRDQSKSKAPSFTFGSKHEDRRDPKTPGPGEYTVDRVTRIGKDWAPTAFVSARYKEPQPYKTPAPGQYNVEGLTRIGKDWTPVAFLSPRYKDPDPFKTPAPTAYNPEKSRFSVKEQAPSYTFGFKGSDPKIDVTPAPTAYNPERSTNLVSNHVQQPSYTCRPKTSLPMDKNPKPGPADYIPENVWINKSCSPSMSFGIRHSPYAL